MDICATDGWVWWHYLGFFGVVMMSLGQGMTPVMPYFDTPGKHIPIKGKHLDELESIDKIYLFINRLLTVPFIFHLIQYTCANSPWALAKMTVWNTLVAFPLSFIVFDLFYTVFHHILHIRMVYGYVHKHHHRQTAPSRGHLDAINVHPFEYIVGQWMHLFVFYVMDSFLVPCHGITVLTMLLVAGLLTTLNHTRYDRIIPPSIYSVKVHDLHHHLPDYNMGQFTMFWDRLFGSYRSPWD